MAKRTAVAAITLTDITVGGDSVVAFLTNENHTFPANNSGLVATIDQYAFYTNVEVLVGGTKQSFLPGQAAPGPGQFTLGNVGIVNGWAAVVSQTNNNEVSTGVFREAGEIYITNIGTSKSAVLPVTISYNANGIVDTFVLELSVNRTEDGAGGTLINLSATTQIFNALSGGEMISNQPASEMIFEITGNPGIMAYDTSLDGAGFVVQTTTGTGPGQIEEYSLDGTTWLTGTLPTSMPSGSRFKIATSNLGDDHETIVIRASGASGGKDAITFAKVRAGKAAITVELEANNSTIFKNNSGPDVTVTARAFDGETGVEVSVTDPNVDSIAYNWQWANGTPVRVETIDNSILTNPDGSPATGGGRVADGSSYNTDNIIVKASNIPDTGDSFAIRCFITVTQIK